MTAHTLACRTGRLLTGSWPGLLENVPPARRWLRNALAAEGREPRDFAETAAAELIANALRHTASGLPGGRFAVSVDTGGPWIWVGVLDEGSAQTPVAADIAPDLMDRLPTDDLPDSGMGIALILSGVTVDWGFEPYGQGRITWATIAR